MRITTTLARRLLVTLCLVALPAQADPAADRFQEGLDRLAEGKFADAADSFAQANAANDEVATYHLNRGVALMMSGDAAGASAELARARKLEPRNPDVTVWDHARRLMYEPHSFPGSPPYNATTYAKRLLNAAVPYGTPQNPDIKAKAKVTLDQVARDFAWKQLGTGGVEVMTARVKTMVAEGRFREAVDTVDRVRAQGPLDVWLLGYSAHAKLGLKDYAVARAEYTQALRRHPATVGWLLGRARCELGMGSLRDAEADFALAGRVDAKMTEAYLKNSEKDLAALRAAEAAGSGANAPAESGAALLASLKRAIAENKTDVELQAIAGPLMRSRTAARHDRDESYTREYARLQIDVNADQQNVEKIAALAEFLINPTVVRKVAIPDTDATARIPLGDGDLPRAGQLLDVAAKLNANHPNVMKQHALWLLTSKRPNDAIRWVDKALASGVQDLDLCVHHLNHYTTVANQMLAEAGNLRTPKSWTSTRDEGNRRITTYHTSPPTAADLARAAQLEAQAKELKRKAHAPLEAFAGKLKDSTDPRSQVLYTLANAHHFRWIGEYGKAVSAAQGALKVDPYELDALTFLIDLCPKVGLKDLGNGYQDFLNNMANPSSGQTLDKIWPQLRETRFTGAAAILADAERIDPTSANIAAARFAIAAENNKVDEAAAAARLVTALEEARLRLGGRTLTEPASAGGSAETILTLSATDAGLAAYVWVRLGNGLDKSGRYDEAVANYRRALAAASRVPAAEWKQKLPNTALTSNARDEGTTLLELISTARRQCAHKMVAAQQYDQALADVVALAALPDQASRGALDIGYDIYRAIGWPKMSGRVPADWKKMFDVFDHQRANARQFGRDPGPANAEVGDLDQRINQINREIQRGVADDDRARLESERDALVARKTALQQAQPRRRGTK